MRPMNVARHDARVEALEKRLMQAREQRRMAIRRQKVRDAKAERRRETRRKILVGALVLERVKRGAWPLDAVGYRKMLNEGLKRDDDRELFGLSPLPAPESPAPAAEGERAAGDLF